MDVPEKSVWDSLVDEVLNLLDVWTWLIRNDLVGFTSNLLNIHIHRVG